MLNYHGTVIRPPSEAGSLILQITLGCSDNGCVFCPAYKDKKFRIKTTEEIEKDIAEARSCVPDIRKVFLADGDALIVPQKKLAAVLDKITKAFPSVTRISSYASVKSVELKTVEELKELRAKKMTLLYCGFETGDDKVYSLINKYGSPAQNAAAVLKLKRAGIKSNVTVILGLGGKPLSERHAVNTAAVLNDSQPEQIAALTLMVVKNTPLYEMCRLKLFELPDKFGIIKELKLLLENLKDFNCLFFANHASNYMPLNARFPKERLNTIILLDDILKRREDVFLRTDFERAL